MFNGRKILIGVTGSVAARKVPELVSKLKNEGAEVDVLTTENAREFLVDDRFAHINLGQKYDLILVAPCTANTISKLANGVCDNLLTQVVIAAECPVWIVPAMNFRMLRNPLIQTGLRRLDEAGYHVLKTEKGRLACGEEGDGRMMSIDGILKEIARIRDLEGKTVLITGGATREKIDSVRFISNFSSGKMAFALANEAFNRGAKVIFIQGWTREARIHPKIRIFEVESARDMFKAVQRHLKNADIFISAAAICDFRPARSLKRKVKGELKVDFVRNPDILARIPKIKDKKYIGFALETENLIKNAGKKLKDKGIDMIIANGIRTLGADEVESVMIYKDNVKKLKKMSKSDFASFLFDDIIERWYN